MFCEQCGSKIGSGEAFCPQCGHNNTDNIVDENNIIEEEINVPKDNIELEPSSEQVLPVEKVDEEIPAEENIAEEIPAVQSQVVENLQPETQMPTNQESNTQFVSSNQMPPQKIKKKGRALPWIIVGIVVVVIASGIGIFAALSVNSFDLNDHAIDYRVEYGINNDDLNDIYVDDFIDWDNPSLSEKESNELQENYSSMSFGDIPTFTEDEKGYLSVGIYSVEIVFEDQTVVVSMIIEDTVAPVIEQTKDIEVTEGVSEIKYESMVSVTELGTYELTFEDDDVKLNTHGTYKVTAKAVDQSGNIGTLELSVVVKEKTTTSSSSSSSSSGSSSVASTCSHYYGATHFNSSSAAKNAADKAAKAHHDATGGRAETRYEYFGCSHGKWIGMWYVPNSDVGGYL